MGRRICFSLRINAKTVGLKRSYRGKRKCRAPVAVSQSASSCRLRGCKLRLIFYNNFGIGSDSTEPISVQMEVEMVGAAAHFIMLFCLQRFLQSNLHSHGLRGLSYLSGQLIGQTRKVKQQHIQRALHTQTVCSRGTHMQHTGPCPENLLMQCNNNRLGQQSANQAKQAASMKKGRPAAGVEKRSRLQTL